MFIANSGLRVKFFIIMIRFHKFVFFVIIRNRTDLSSSVAVQRVVYVDQHGKVLGQHTAPAVIVDFVSAFRQRWLECLQSCDFSYCIWTVLFMGIINWHVLYIILLSICSLVVEQWQWTRFLCAETRHDTLIFLVNCPDAFTLVCLGVFRQ